jgi:hypothetical protein
MTTQGCKECPSEEVIKPFRNAALGIVITVGLLLWFWYSWSPFFPSIGEKMSKMMVAVASRIMKQSGNVSKISEIITAGLEYSGKLRLPQYFKIFVSYLQVMSSFMDFHVPWPALLLNAMLWCKATFNFNILAMPGVSCLWKGLHYNDKLVAYTIVPLGFTLMLFLPLTAIFFLKKNQVQVDRQIVVIIKDRCWNAVMILCFLVSNAYPAQCMLCI